MAIKVGGTTVIDDSRNISNVGTVTATSFSGDGSNLTNLPSSGGISPTEDAFPNGVRVGKGVGNEITSTVVGLDAGAFTPNASRTTIMGYRSHYYGSGNGHTAFGAYTMENAEVGGEWMTVVGGEACKSPAYATNGVVIGAEAQKDAGGGAYFQDNVFIGREAGWGSQNASSYNIAIGGYGGNFGVYSSGNIEIGSLTSAGGYSPAYNGFGSFVNNILSLGHRSISGAYVNTSWSVVSDARDKMDIAPLELGLDFVDQLKPVSYKRKMDRDTNEPNGGTHYGFLAQDVLEVEGENPVIVQNEDPENLTLRHDDMVAVLVNAVKELRQEVNLLKSEVNALKGV
jgi:hypothetical protein